MDKLERALDKVIWNEAWISFVPLERDQISVPGNEIAGTRLKLERAGTRGWNEERAWNEGIMGIPGWHTLTHAVTH